MEKYKVVKSNLFDRLFPSVKVEGKKNVPKSIPVIFCGTHLSEDDEIIVTSSAGRRMISWQNVREHSNNEKVEVPGNIINYVKKGGSIGFFAEETINIYHLAKLRIDALEHEKERIMNNPFLRSGERMTAVYNISQIIESEIRELNTIRQELLNRGINIVGDGMVLPFSQDAVALSNKTGAPIVPFAVLGSDSLRNGFSVKQVSFDEPFQVHDESSAQIYLEERVKKLVYKYRG